MKKITAAKAKRGAIEDAVDNKKTDRLNTGTIIRHSRAVVAILDWGVVLGEISNNPMRLCIASAKEITAQTRREKSGERDGWTEAEFQRLFTTPCLVEGPSEVDDEPFWAP